MDSETQERILELLDDGKTANEIVKILKDEDSIKISKATINRTRRLTTVLGDDKKLTPEERDVYLSYMKKSVEKKEKKNKIWHTIFSPITRTAADGPFDPNMPEISENGHQSFLNNYTPKNNFEAIDVDVNDKGNIMSSPVPFTAKKNGINTIPKFFWNPYTALDLIVFQDVYTHTVCGTIIDVIVAFSIGMGIHPVLKLINEDIPDDELQEKDVSKKDKKIPIKEKQKENPETDDDDVIDSIIPEQKPQMETRQEALERILDENKSLLDPLIAVDNSFGDQQNQEGIAEDWNTKVEALMRNHWIFGRDLMTMEPDPDNVFEWDNKKWLNIRNIAKVQHPRDINFIEIEQKTFNIVRVSLMFSPDMLEKTDMIYLAHMENSPIYNGKGYGYSMEQRMLGNGRSLRKLIDRDFPNIASIGYAPFTIVATKRDEKGTTNEASQGQTFINTMVAGQPNHTALKDPKNDLVVHHIDTKPDIPGIIEMAHYHAEAAAKTVQVPTSLVAKEKDPNRDCYSEDTMTLTESGWKYYNEIDWRNERIATFNPDNGNIEYHYPDKMSVYPYEGDMIHVKTKNQDVMVTPDHDMWVSSSHIKPNFKKIKAEKLLEKKEFVFTEFGNWVGNYVPEMYPLETVSLQASGNNLQALQMSSVKINTWLKFMGYYISEGTKSYTEKYGSEYFVSIAQHENSEHYEEFKTCMDEMPFHYYDNSDKSGCHRFRFSNKQLVHNLKDTGRLHNTKQIPRWMLNLKPDKMQILFDALMQGDGTIGKSGTKSYYTTSIQLARDVQELAMKLGYATNIKTCHEAKGNRVKLYRVFISKTKRHLRRVRNTDVKRAPYKGIVYCFGVQNHLFVTSRNGTVTVQGNTLLGILRVFAETEIPRKRLPVKRAFTHQHYMVNFREFYKDKPEILKKFRVEAEFTDVKIDSWADIVNAFLELNKIFRFTADAAGEILGIENLEGKIDTEKEPLGESNMMQDDSGNTLTMTKAPPKPKKST